MPKEISPTLRAVGWLPQSIYTKYRYHGFQPESTVDDGSRTTINLIDGLAIQSKPLLGKVFDLYANGVNGYEGRVFSPKQILSMIVHLNSYEPGEVRHWVGGIRTEDGIIYGPKGPKNLELLSLLCETLEMWDTTAFKELAPASSDCLRGTIGKTGEITDHDLAVYLVANYAQLVFLMIHPFWNRNGRTSEEFMHLFCVANHAPKLVFWQDYTRYTPASASRMDLINNISLDLLVNMLKRFGVETVPDLAVTDGYKQFFLRNPKLFTKLALHILSPYHYRFVSGLLSRQQSKEYFDAIEREVMVMIDKLKPRSFPALATDQTATKLLEHHLQFGHPDTK